jgi:hypothetical protein
MSSLTFLSFVTVIQAMVAMAVLVAMAATPGMVAMPVCVLGGNVWLPLLLASALFALLHVKPHFSFLAIVIQATVATAVLVAMVATPLTVATPVGVRVCGPQAPLLFGWLST